MDDKSNIETQQTSLVSEENTDTDINRSSFIENESTLSINDGSKSIEEKAIEYTDFISKILAKINTVLVLILKKLEDTLNLVNSLITNSFIFLRTSLEIKNIKRVLFILIMSIAMAFVLVGVNLIFGKLIL